MYVITPIDLEAIGATVTTTATESYPAWASGGTYAAEDVRYYDAIGTHRLWMCVLAVSGSTTPPPNDPQHWQDIGPNNKWAMFDLSSSTTTQRLPDFSVTITIPDQSSAVPGENYTTLGLGLFGLVAGNVTVTVFEADGTTVKTTNSYGVLRYSDKNPGNIVQTGIALNGFASTKILIFFNGSYGPGSITAQCASLVIGPVQDIGTAQYSPTLGIVSYSKKDTDTFGTTTLIKRASSKRVSVSTLIKNTDMETIYNTLAALDGVGAAWVVSDVAVLKPLNVFGFTRDFSVVVEYANDSLCNLEIEGLA